MRKRTKKAEASKPIIKVGETYRDAHRDALVTVEDHEMVGGKRTGRVVVIGAGVGEHFPRRWICPAEDLIEVDPSPEDPAPGKSA
jgi:hypothetical protein